MSEGTPHEGDITLGADAGTGLGALRARFVRYPGCQQLQLWLPQSGWEGYTTLRVRQASGHLLLDTTVRACLGGNVQMLFDTLHWPPGELHLEIDHASGGGHRLALHKSHDGTPPTLPQPASEADAGEDLRLHEQLREQLLRDLAERFAAPPPEDPSR